MDADFTDETLSSWSRKLDKMLDDIDSKNQFSKQNISPEAIKEPGNKRIMKQVRFYSTK